MIILSSLPEDPGCYLFKDNTGMIIYIGKAKNLKKRVSSYFQKTDHDAKTRRLVTEAADLDFIVTASEVEALILENNLIKKHQPKYNIDLKDAKSYAFIQISDDPFPRIGIARYRGGKKGGALYGPFVSAAERDQVLSFIKQTFHLRTCRKMTKRACLRYHLGTCSAPCQGLVSEPEYQYQVKNADLLLKGKNQDLIHDLKDAMNVYAGSQQYEQALILRDQIASIERLSERQYVQRQKQANEHIINYIIVSDTVYLILFTIERGTLTSKEDFVFPDTEEFLEEFIIQYYATVRPPNELILPNPADDSVRDYLTSLRGTQVAITVPQKGAKKHLLDLVEKNIEASFFRGKMQLIELGEILRLASPPEVIECFDISHLSGTGTVGSMIRFTDGKPDKKNYRRFKIKTVEGIDDFASIAEVVHRRYSRLKKENALLPDLIIIDGGQGQLSAAVHELKKLELSTPIISIAKREEELFIPGRTLPLTLSKKSPASLLVQEIRDEAHRFAITYQRQLRQKKTLA
ncbi:MAG TPA: excinuclease ABC subunit UvrC [Methanospirillum sp.]|nr:excinuclease ABC subunit UvrC [Methanospirillum sp.]